MEGTSSSKVDHSIDATDAERTENATAKMKATLVPSVEPVEVVVSATAAEGTTADNDDAVGYGATTETTTTWTKGQVQAPEYRDVPAAVVFLIHLLIVTTVAFWLGPVALSHGDGDNGDDNEGSSSSSGNSEYKSKDDDDSSSSLVFTDPSTVFSAMWILLATPICAIGAIMAFFRLTKRYAETMVEISFFAVPAMFISTAVLILLTGDTDAFQVFALISLGVGALMLCLYMCYKKFIPFAAANLQTALAALQVHSGLYALAGVGLLVVLSVWSVVWSIAVGGVFYQAGQQPDVPCPKDQYGNYYENPNGNGMCPAQPNAFVVVLLILSYYWTQQVLQNVLHCTTAGAVGSWWFAPVPAGLLGGGNGGGCCSCSTEVNDSLHRACTFSFGSICLGSLLVAIMQTLEQLLHGARRHGRNGLVRCVAECLLALLRAMMEYFNSYAFIYVALYGYDYVTAGKNVMRLFRDRGWTTVISDRLVFRVLFFCQLAIACLSGALALLANILMGPKHLSKEEASGWRYFVFAFAFVVGLIMSSTALFVLESAVRTVMVCFAESPAALAQAHPAQAAKMNDGWARAYPDIWNPQAAAAVGVAFPMAAAAGAAAVVAVDGGGAHELGNLAMNVV